MIEAWLDVLMFGHKHGDSVRSWNRCLRADATHEVTFSVDRHYIRSSWDRTKATGRGACGDLWSMRARDVVDHIRPGGTHTILF